MNDAPEILPDAAELIAAEAAAVVADESLMPLPPASAGVPVVHGAVWTVAGFGFMQVLRFGSNLILTRLVEKYVFGVITTVGLILQGLHMFSDLGVRQCVVNSPRGDDDRFLNTAWTVQVVRGFLLLFAAVLVAWPLGTFYGQPEMYWLVPLIGLTAVCDGFMSTAMLTMSRRLERGALVIREVAAYSVGASVVIVWLLLLRYHSGAGGSTGGQQMLAFVAGNVVTAMLELAFSYTLIRGVRNYFTWDADAAKELMHFGGWIFISTALTFLANNLDRLYVGKVSQEALADYNIAAQLARLPTLLIAQLGHQFVFPLYGKLLRSGMPLSVSFPKLHTAITGFAAFLVSGAFAAGPTFVWMVFPEQYRFAGDYVRWLSIGAWFTILQTSSEVALLAEGRTRWLAIGQGVKFVLLLPLLVLGHYFFDIEGVIAGYTLAEAARYVVLSSTLSGQGLPVLRLDFVMTLLIAIAAVLAMAVGPCVDAEGHRLVRFGMRLAVEATLVTLVWGLLLAIWWPRHGRQALAVIQKSGSPS